MFDRPTRREFSAFAVALVAAGGRIARAQDEPEKPDVAAADAPQAGALPGPDPVPEVKLLPVLPTVPVRRGSQHFNVNLIDTSLLPRDKEGIWVLDFGFKSLRMYSVEIGGKRRLVHYLYYRVVNRTGKPRDFVPQFTMVTEPKTANEKRYEEAVIPKAVSLIQAREDPTVRLLGAVDIAGVIPPSTKRDIDDAVFGVAIWEGIDAHADRLSIYIRGLSDGYKPDSEPYDAKSAVKYKTLKIDLIRRGDARNLNEKEITLAEPPYEWVYW